MAVRVVLERGPKARRSVAFALDWPGWSRGASTPESAVERLESYRDRYRPVAELAGLAAELDASGPIEIVEDRTGTSSTDFWGISFSPSAAEADPMDGGELERKLRIIEACWAYFDRVAAQVSTEMARGPRGGGRDRDQIVRHTLRNESGQFAKRLGLRNPEDLTDTPDGLDAHRRSYLAAMRRYQAGELKPMRTWTLAFLVRHTGYHVMDHAWEMEDKDLSDR